MAKIPASTTHASSGAKANAVGTVKSTSGEVVAISASGGVCKLQPGDKVFPNDIIQTSEGGSVQIEFAKGAVADLGRNDSLLISDDIFSMDAALAPSEGELDDIASIQARIAAGADPTQVTDASAAGGEGRRDHEGLSFVELKQTQGGVQSGFDTDGIGGRIQTGFNTDGSGGRSGDDGAPALGGSQQFATTTRALSAGFVDTGTTDAARHDGITSNPNITIGVIGGVLVTAVTATGPTGVVSYALADGQWKPVTPLADGTYTVTVTGVDPAGKAMAATTTYTIDTAPPPLTVDSLHANGISASAAPVISGTGEAGSIIEVNVHSAPQHFQLTVGADGHWSVSPAALEDGQHELSVTEYDHAGNAATLSFQFAVDTHAPTDGVIRLDSVTSDNAINKAEATADTITITGSIAGEHQSTDTVTLTVGGIDYTASPGADGKFSVDVPGSELAKAGSISATFTAHDAAGNFETVSTAETFTVITESPTVDIVVTDPGTHDTPTDDHVTNDNTVTITATDPATTPTVTVTVDDVPTTPVGGEITLTDGTHEIEVTATDGAGNTATDSTTVTVDTVAPTVDIAVTDPGTSGTSTTDNVTNDNTVTIVAVDPTTTPTVTVTVDDVPTTPVGGEITLTDGTHEIELTATDGAGNTATDSTTVTVDTVAPTVAITNNNDGTVTVTATDTTTAATLQVTVDGGISQTFVGTAAGTVTDVIALTDGPHTITATASDGAGNASESVVSNVVINTVVPEEAPVNAAPSGTATAALAAGVEDKAYNVSAADLLKGFSDSDSDTLSVVGLAADHGTVTANPDGSFTITPAADYDGPMTLSYHVSDGQAAISATQSYLVTEGDKPPASGDGGESEDKDDGAETHVASTESDGDRQAAVDKSDSEDNRGDGPVQASNSEHESESSSQSSGDKGNSGSTGGESQTRVASNEGEQGGNRGGESQSANSGESSHAPVVHNDILTGTSGHDIFALDRDGGIDIITNFQLAIDAKKADGKEHRAVAADSGDTLDIHELISGLPSDNASSLVKGGYLVFEKSSADSKDDSMTLTLKIDVDGKGGHHEAQSAALITVHGVGSLSVSQVVDQLLNHNQIKTHDS